MKRIEELENMTIQELEAEALRTVAEVPEGLEKELEAAIASDSAIRAGRGRRPFTTVAACLAVAASLTAAGIFIFRDTPLHDTYDNPMDAYAEVERTFAYISGKMSPGIGLAMEGKQKFDDTTVIFKQTKK
ncbi:MAG: hypothetical protein ACI3ZL_06855 [Candidatus Cryptobacteroides sp.]